MKPKKTPAKTSIKERVALARSRAWMRWDGGQKLWCEGCGDSYEMTMPASITIVSAVLVAFQKDHEACKPQKKGRGS